MSLHLYMSFHIETKSMVMFNNITDKICINHSFMSFFFSIS